MKVKAGLIRAMGEPFKIEEVDLDEPRLDYIIVRIAGVVYAIWIYSWVIM